MRTYVINLDKDHGRLTSARAILNSLGLEMVRIPAINGTLLPKNHFLSAGEVGCFQSHVLALETFLKSADPEGIIFEDDIACPLSQHEFQSRMDLATKHLPNYDIMYLGKCFCNCGTFNLIEGDLYETRGALCLHAYFISRAGARKLLQTIGDKRYAIDPIDLIYYNASITGRIKTAVFHPSLFQQDATHLSNLRSTGDVKRIVNTECASAKDLVPWHTIFRRTRGYLRVYWWVGLILIILVSYWFTIEWFQ